jgi:hypothetical protein
MGHFGQIVPNNIYNKYVLVATPSDQASHSHRMFAIIILSLWQIYCPCIRYMISVNLENNDDKKMSYRKRLETTLYLRTLGSKREGGEDAVNSLKGTGTSVDVLLYIYDRFNQKCIKFGTVTTQYPRSQE